MKVHPLEELLALAIEATNRHELGDEVRRIGECYSLLAGKIGEPSGLDFVEKELRTIERQIMKRISSKESKWNTYRNLLEANLKASLARDKLEADLARDELSRINEIKMESIKNLREKIAKFKIGKVKNTEIINDYILQSHDRLLNTIRNPLRKYYLWKRTILWLPKLSYLCVVFLVFVIGLTVVGSNIKSISLGLFLAISAWIVQEFFFVPYITKWIEKLREENILNALEKLSIKDNSLYLIEAILDKDLYDFS